MRSTETSGVGGDGFERAKPAHRGRLAAAILLLWAWTGTLSQVTVAVAITALAAATLFVIADTARTFEDMHFRTVMVSRLAAAQPILARQFIAGYATPLPDSVDRDAAIGGIAGRAGLAYAFAALCIGLAFRRRGPQALEHRDDLRAFDDLLSTIPFGVACWTQEGTLIVCNEQYRARVQLEGGVRRAGTSYHASIKRLTQGGYVQLVAEDTDNRVLELHREDGSCLLIDERPLRGGGFVTLVTDVTERRRTDHMLSSIREEQRVLARRYHEEKLKAEAASSSKTSFLAHLSHDIRTPLNHIIGFAELIRQQTYGPIGDARYASYVEDIKSSGERLLSFFASILDFAELESGARVLQAHELSVDELLVGVRDRYAAQARRAKLRLVLGAPCGALLVGDRFSLDRALSNLVDNAIRFTPAGGRIKIASHVASDGVVLEVTDTGIGMPAERLSALSQPFAFGDPGLTKEREGAGLGLAIARTIIELSGGHLAIDSRPGLGTTVAVSLPLSGTEPQISAAA